MGQRPFVFSENVYPVDRLQGVFECWERMQRTPTEPCRNGRLESMRLVRTESGDGIRPEIERLLAQGSLTGLTEKQLLERFTTARDELAFEALVERHGPMVLGVCRRFLRDPNDIDDAFQATFLVLVRKAASLNRKELLGNWLFGVAHRVALRSRASSWRKKAATSLEIDLAGLAGDGRTDPRSSALESASKAEEAPLIQEEVFRLPVKYRMPVVLCYLEGRSHEQAASELGWPVGTVKGRLSRARDLLRSRLSRRGVTVSATALAATLAAGEVEAVVPPPLSGVTLRAALAITRGTGFVPASSSTISLSVWSLSEGVINAMLMSQVRSILIAIAVAGGLLATCATVFAFQGSGQPAGARRPRAGGSAGVEAGKQAGSSQPGQPGNQPGPGAAAAPQGGAPPAGGQPQGGGGGFVGGIGGFGGDAGDAPDEAQMRVAIAAMTAAISATDKNPKNQETFKRLERPVTLSFPEETPLDAVLRQIKEVSKGQDGKKVPIYVDPIGMQEAEKTMQSPVTIDLEDVPLRFSLRLILKQLGLAYCIRDGVVIISSVEGIQQELREAEAEMVGMNPEKYPGMMERFGRMGRMGGGMGGMGGMGMMSPGVP